MSTDVNAEFAAERATQIEAAKASAATQEAARATQQSRFDARIADGTLRDIGNGRFQVTQPGSWDNGEVLFLRQNGPVKLILPEHGLDTSLDGTVKLFTAQPPWHELGNVILGGTTDIDTALFMGGIDYPVIKMPASFLWDGEYRPVPDAFVNVNGETGAPLGAPVGKVYTPIQARDAYDFLNAILGDDLICESAGQLRGGQKIFISMRLPQPVIIDEGGLAEQVHPFIAAMDDRAGGAPFTVVVTPWRPVCGNTERFAVRDAAYKWAVRHTSRAMDKMEEARRTLKLTGQYYDAFAAEETELARTDITIDEFEKFLAEMLPAAPGAGKVAARRHEEKLGKVREVFGLEAGRVGRTAYAAERAFTGYLDHGKGVRQLKTGDGLAAARATMVYEGTEDAAKSTAHARLLTLKTR